MIAYSYDRDTGAYTGEVNAWESPLEPGEYLLPAFATFTAPPGPQEGHYRSWNGTSWEYTEIPLPPAPEPPTIEDQQVTIRNDRNGRLALSDWTQLPDVPLSSEVKAAWATYRQALRDVPQQAGFPQEVTWPQIPS